MWLIQAGLSPAYAADANLDTRVQALMAPHPGKTGTYILEKGEESLLARAWLTDQALRTINVQYFIWSTDNIGILAAEALLRAAERGVQVRVLVDDLLIDAEDQLLLALAKHPNVAIRIYNPKHSVGVSRIKRMLNLVTDFRGANQRMHDKTFIVDGHVGIVGGRNMADEYFDYDHAYNFRDRDALLIGPTVKAMQQSFEQFWQSDLAVPVQQLLSKPWVKVDAQQVQNSYNQLHAYAEDTDNFSAEVRDVLKGMEQQITPVIEQLVWDDVSFISDVPGKNTGKKGLAGGGRSTDALIHQLEKARHTVTIQSPYLVMPEGGEALFKRLIKRGVKVRISTNSLASTDNLMAFSGYHKQRASLLSAGIDVFEFRPNPEIQRTLINRYQELEKQVPVFAIHAKTLVIDGETLFVGTFNLDPRSANLNTEIGVLIHNPMLAAQVEANIVQDMQPGNSWDARKVDADAKAPLSKRIKLPLLKLLPLKPVL